MKTKLKIIIPTIIAIAAVITAAFCISFTSNTSQNIDKMLSTAQKYLVEQNYEQAVAEFNKIIELDPMNADAYLGLAQAYIDMGDTEKAVETLEKGFELTQDERLKEFLEKLLQTEKKAETSVTETSSTEDETTQSDNSEAESAQTATENKLSEQIKTEAYEIIELFDIYKENSEPYSTVFYSQKYSSDYGEYSDVSKCLYDSSGNITQSISVTYYNALSDLDITQPVSDFTENDYQNNSASMYNKDYKIKWVSDSTISTNNACGYKCIKYSDEAEENNDCFVYGNSSNEEKIYVYVSEWNEITSIEIDTIYFKNEYFRENENWVCRCVYKYDGSTTLYYPCETGIPSGVDQSEFEIPADLNSYKSFDSSDEYNKYKREILYRN